MTDLSGKVGFITGAAGGIGFAIASALIEADACLMLTDIDREKGESAQSLLGDHTHFIQLDVTDSKSMQFAVAEAVKRFGKLDFAINVAGILGPVTPLVELDEEAFKRVISVNLDGTWMAMKAQIPCIIETGGGTILNVASVNGLRGSSMTSAYSASKHGVVGLTRTAAIEYGSAGIRINALCPGAFPTELLFNALATRDLSAFGHKVPLGRVGELAEIGKAARWILGAEASYVNGHIFVVDGGLLA